MSELCVVQCDFKCTRARQCDDHNNSFNVELKFRLVGICMAVSVQSVHFRVARNLSPPVWPKNLSSGQKPEYFKGGGSIYMYLCVCVYACDVSDCACRYVRLCYVRSNMHVCLYFCMSVSVYECVYVYMYVCM